MVSLCCFLACCFCGVGQFEAVRFRVVGLWVFCCCVFLVLGRFFFFFVNLGFSAICVLFLYVKLFCYLVLCLWLVFFVVVVFGFGCCWFVFFSPSDFFW